MLTIAQQSRWIPWPEAGVRFLLKPLASAQRAKFAEMATVKEGSGKSTRTRVDTEKFQNLVADHCIQNWDGVVAVPEPTAENPEPQAVLVPYSKEAAQQLMLIEPASNFIFATVQGLGIHLAGEVEKAGND